MPPVRAHGPALFEGCTIVYGVSDCNWRMLCDLNRFDFGSDSCESKQDVSDFWLILYCAGAVLIFLKLRSVLQQRTRRERPPYEVTLPGRAAEPPKPIDVAAAAPSADRWAGIADAGSVVAAGLDAIAREDKSFDAKNFIAGARAAYEMIVTAFAEGDRRTLKNLLSRDVYDGFEMTIRNREGTGETTESRFVSIDKSDITDAELRGRTAQITIRFVSQLVSATRDRNGNVIDGSPDKVTDVTDVWTFARDLSLRDPNWNLVATEAGR